jgi:hypothetical protein
MPLQSGAKGQSATPLTQQRGIGLRVARELGFNPAEYREERPEGSFPATLVMKIWGVEPKTLYCYFRLDDGRKVAARMAARATPHCCSYDYATLGSGVDMSFKTIGGRGVVTFAGPRRLLHDWTGEPVRVLVGGKLASNGVAHTGPRHNFESFRMFA